MHYYIIIFMMKIVLNMHYQNIAKPESPLREFNFNNKNNVTSSHSFIWRHVHPSFGQVILILDRYVITSVDG